MLNLRRKPGQVILIRHKLTGDEMSLGVVKEQQEGDSLKFVFNDPNYHFIIERPERLARFQREGK